MALVPQHPYDRCTQALRFHFLRWFNCGSRNVRPEHSLLNQSAERLLELLDELPGPLVLLGDSLLRDFFMTVACTLWNQNILLVPPRAMKDSDWGRRGVTRLRRDYHGRTIMSYVWWRPVSQHGPQELNELREAGLILTNLGLTHAHNQSEAYAWIDEFRSWTQHEQRLLHGRGEASATKHFQRVMTLAHPHMSHSEIELEHKRRRPHVLPMLALHETLPTHFPSTDDGEYDLEKQGKFESRAIRRTCAAHRAYPSQVREANWRNAMTSELARTMSLPIVRFWEPLATRDNDHKTPSDIALAPIVRRGDPAMDCRHWCNPGISTIQWSNETLPNFLRDTILPRLLLNRWLARRQMERERRRRRTLRCSNVSGDLRASVGCTPVGGLEDSV